MTVCLAAICHHNQRPFIVGAADRMLTSGDIEFNSAHTKVHQVCRSIAVMTAGDSDPHTYALDKTAEHFAPTQQQTLQQVAEYYSERLNEFRRRHAEQQAFGDLGMNVASFVNSQSNMSPAIASDLHYAFQRHWIFCEALVCGTDPSGAHILAVDNKGSVASKYDVGFDSIGTGARHAMSQFMFARHSRSSNLVDTLFLVYRSKKFAEAAPGVGDDTDLFYVGREGMSFFSLDTREALDEVYREYREGLAIAENTARHKTRKYLQRVWTPQPESQDTDPGNSDVGESPT